MVEKPLSAFELAKLRNVGAGFPEPERSERIVLAMLNHFHDKEITVLYADLIHEFFRVGVSKLGQPSHGVIGVHVHECYEQHQTKLLKVDKDASALRTSSKRQIYVDYLFEALSKGFYRTGLKQPR